MAGFNFNGMKSKLNSMYNSTVAPRVNGLKGTISTVAEDVKNQSGLGNISVDAIASKLNLGDLSGALAGFDPSSLLSDIDPEAQMKSMMEDVKSEIDIGSIEGVDMSMFDLNGFDIL